MDIVYKGRTFAVEVGRVAFPNGMEHHIEVVRHPPSVVLIPIHEDGSIVLVRQYRASLSRMLWELPAGSVKEGETAEDAAARECEEETGLVPGRIQRLAGLYPAPGFCDEQLVFFRLTDLRPAPEGSQNLPDADEDIEVSRFGREQARGMVTRGEIVDLKTAYGLTLA
jgi:ADP-ribose pyrophosphatase